MKFFLVFFSAFILFLSISPCCDEGDCSDTPKGYSKNISKDQHNESDHQEVCSPFCLCSCCGSHVANTGIASTVIPISLIEQNEININLYTFQGTSKFEATIWQPPQIG